MTNISTSDFQKGIFIEYKNEPHQIVEFQFVNPGKGSAFVRTKLKYIKTGKVQEFTFKSGETVNEVPVTVREMQYLYKDNDNLIFMDRFTYEQVAISKTVLSDFYPYLKDGEIYQIYIHESEALGIRKPKKVKLDVVEADEAVKGNTLMGAKKIVILENGLRTAVPLFIKKGDKVIIDPETGEYIERDSSNK